MTKVKQLRDSQRSAYGEPEARSLSHAPKWLVGDVSDRQWKVKCAKSREAEEGWVGLQTLRWDILLPRGQLIDVYEQLTQQAKSLLLIIFDEGNDVASSRLVKVHRTLLLIMERMALESESAVFRSGLAEFDVGMAAEMVGAQRTGGAAAVARFYQRFIIWLKTRIAQVGKSELRRWLGEQSKERKTIIFNSARSALSLEPDEMLAVIITEGTSFLRWARVLLNSEHMIDEHGFLDHYNVASAIGTDVGRLARAKRLLYQLRQFENVTDYRSKAIPLGSTRTEKAEGQLSAGELYHQEQSNDELIVALKNLSWAASEFTELTSSQFANQSAFADELDPLSYKNTQRTRLLPKAVADKLLFSCLDWIFRTAPGLVRLVLQIPTVLPLPEQFTKYRTVTGHLSACFEAIPEKRIGKHSPRQFWSMLATESRLAANDGDHLSIGVIPVALREVGVVDLVDIHIAVCFTIIAWLSCSRLAEVLDIKDEDLLWKHGRWFLAIRVRKNKVGSVWRTMIKPVPPAVAIAIHSLMSMRNCMEHAFSLAASNPERFVFRSWVENHSVLSNTSPESMYPRLETMSEYFDLRTSKGVRWVASPHEFRKKFGHEFINDGGVDNVLAALTWFMGHGDDISKTWHYLKPDLARDEISAVEAGWAATALRTQPEEASVAKLRELLESHFNTSNISTLSEDEMQDYLELLQASGKYTAEKKPIRDGKGQRYTVLVHIKKS